MVFSSTVFLFLFLPTVLAIYAAIPLTSGKNSFLFLASLFFYFWGEPFFVGVMVISMGWNDLCGLLIYRYRGRPGAARICLTLGVSANLLLLLVYKYSNFMMENLNPLLASAGMGPLELDPVRLPIGISLLHLPGPFLRGGCLPRRRPRGEEPLESGTLHFHVPVTWP
jgi:alginate O-acetyltransferase complex protein AlgI